MTAGDHKLRIALAVFDAADALAPAVAALIGEGVLPARVGLIMLRSASQLLPTIAPDAATETALGTLIGGLAPLADGDGHEILASPSLIELWRVGLRAPALWANAPGQVAEPRLAADLERQVRRGAAILSVQSTTPGEQWLCARILLEQSSSPVLALECSLPPAT